MIHHLRVEEEDHLEKLPPDELDAPVGAIRQGFENVGVEDEGTVHRPRVMEGAGEGSVVLVPQIAAKPHQHAVETFAHGVLQGLGAKRRDAVPLAEAACNTGLFPARGKRPSSAFAGNMPL
jgi:hypothetical protein